MKSSLQLVNRILARKSREEKNPEASWRRNAIHSKCGSDKF